MKLNALYAFDFFVTCFAITCKNLSNIFKLTFGDKDLGLELKL